jgi:ethanolamine utilization protein EutP (predicted NTPase)
MKEIAAEGWGETKMKIAADTNMLRACTRQTANEIGNRAILCSSSHNNLAIAQLVNFDLLPWTDTKMPQQVLL